MKDCSIVKEWFMLSVGRDKISEKNSGKNVIGVEGRKNKKVY